MCSAPIVRRAQAPIRWVLPPPAWSLVHLAPDVRAGFLQLRRDAACFVQGKCDFDLLRRTFNGILQAETGLLDPRTQALDEITVAMRVGDEASDIGKLSARSGPDSPEDERK